MASSQSTININSNMTKHLRQDAKATKMSLKMAKQILRKQQDVSVTGDGDMTLLKARSFFARSFAGTSESSIEPVAQWALRPFGDDLMTESRMYKRAEFLRYFFGFGIRHEVKKSGGFVFGIHNDEKRVAGQNSSIGEDLVGAIVLRSMADSEKSPSIFTFLNAANDIRTHFGMAMEQGGVPNFDKTPGAEKKTIARFEHLEDAKVPHQAVDVNIPEDALFVERRNHWYVAMVGVDPHQQGRGNGKKLMTRLGDVADECNANCYLECSGLKRKAFYERMGYHVYGEASFKAPDDGADELHIFLMVRPAARPHPDKTRYLSSRGRELE